MVKHTLDNKLYYGDNLDVLIKYIKDESIDLCYIDPPFNSKRNYNQIYNNIGKDDVAQAQAFIDTWTWGHDDLDAYHSITISNTGFYPKQCVELIIGLKKVLGEGSLMAYLLSMTVRIAQIHRVLKPTGSFYLHCDPTASHYLKLILDSIFCSQGGEFQNEIIWKRTSAHSDSKTMGNSHDVILLYTKSNEFICNKIYQKYDDSYIKSHYSKIDENGRQWQDDNLTAKGLSGGGYEYEYKGVKSLWRCPIATMEKLDKEGRLHFTRNGGIRLKRYLDEMPGMPLQDTWTDIPPINSQAKERLGYPTQKPESLLERIINTSSNDGDTVLDAFCGCGTTIAVAQKLNRKWIGIDITYQSIAVILKRLEDHYGSSILDNIELHGIPRDIEAAIALANKKDDRVRKEFEKWAVLTYSNNKARINDKKGADGGVDGTAYMLTGHDEHKQVLFSVKSGNVGVDMIKSFCHTVKSLDAAMGIFITLEPPTKPMRQEAINMGAYINPLTNQSYPTIEIITIEDILAGKRLNLPHTVDVLKSAERKTGYEKGQSKLEI